MRFLRPDEVAQRLGLSKASVYHLAKQGRIPHVRIGRSVRIPEEYLERLRRDALGSPS